MREKQFEVVSKTTKDLKVKEQDSQPKPELLIPPELKKRMDAILQKVQLAGTYQEKRVLLKEYQQLFQEAKKEHEKEQEQQKLVEFRDEQIYNFELLALEELVTQINQDYAEQRKTDPKFDKEDVSLDELDIAIEKNNVVYINLLFKKLSIIPEAINKLVNLEWLTLNDNKIKEIKNLDKLTNLEKLNLDNNNIKEIKNLDGLVSLKKLVLRNNLIDFNSPTNKAQIEYWEKKLGGDFSYLPL